MTEKSDTKIEGVSQFEAEIKKIQEVFREKETEHTWQSFETALKRLTALTRDGAYKFENVFFPSIKALRQPILNSISTERTRLSGTACEFVEQLGQSLGTKFEPFADIFVPAVLKLCARTNKVFITRAQKCIITIIRECRIHALIPKFKEALGDQSKSLKTCAAEFILVSLEVNDVGELMDYITDLEWSIREGAVDSTPAVRTMSKKSFEIYKLKFDLRFQGFADTLSLTAKKYLGVLEKQPIKTTRPPIRRLTDREHSSQQSNTSKEDTAFIIAFDELNIGSKEKEKPAEEITRQISMDRDHFSQEHIGSKEKEKSAEEITCQTSMDRDHFSQKHIGSKEKEKSAEEITCQTSMDRDHFSQKHIGSKEKEKSAEETTCQTSTDRDHFSQKPDASEESTAFVVTFDEPSTENILATDTGFAALKRPKLSSAKRVKSVPVLPLSAQRVTAKPSRSQTTINLSKTSSLIGGAQRIKIKEASASNSEEKQKISRLNIQQRVNYEKIESAKKSDSTPKIKKDSKLHIKPKNKENVVPKIKRTTLSVKRKDRRFSPYKRERANNIRRRKLPPKDSALAKRQLYSQKLAAEVKKQKELKKKKKEIKDTIYQTS